MDEKNVNDLIGKYFGTNKIRQIERTDDEEVFKLYFEENDNILEVPEYELFACANDEALDETWMLRKRCIAVQEEITGLLLDMNVRIGDVGSILNNVSKDLQDNWNKASDKLFGSLRADLRLKRIDEVLKA